MKNLQYFIVGYIAMACVGMVQAAEQSVYAGQEHRDIKAMSNDEVSGYLLGKGMGMAKAAELNGYPGPKHVLDLASELQLSEEQLQRTEQLFLLMQAEAKRLGEQLVILEKTLDEAFVIGSVTHDELISFVHDIERVRADIRTAHLSAHLEQRELLSSRQLVMYNRERGYDAPSAMLHHHGHH